jgi:hypothetical protein
MKAYKVQISPNGDRSIYRRVKDGWQYVSTRAAVGRANKLQCENESLEARLDELKGLAKRVMDLLEEHGASILPHLLDTDENAGQQLREALEEVGDANS